MGRTMREVDKFKKLPIVFNYLWKTSKEGNEPKVSAKALC